MLLLMSFTYVQEHKSKIAELESSNARISHDLADFKTESKGLKNQDLTIKRLEGQLAQLKAQLQSKVKLLHAGCTGFIHARLCNVECTATLVTSQAMPSVTRRCSKHAEGAPCAGTSKIGTRLMQNMHQQHDMRAKVSHKLMHEMPKQQLA